jgi:hypothetical protein
VLRLDPPAPGAEAQVDYGQLGRWTDPATGTRHTVHAFAMVLSCSRHLFVRPVIGMDQTGWADALRPLPAEPFVLAAWSTGKVGPDIHVKVGGCLYSLPWKHIGAQVDARSTHRIRSRCSIGGRGRGSGEGVEAADFPSAAPRRCRLSGTRHAAPVVGDEDGGFILRPFPLVVRFGI